MQRYTTLKTYTPLRAKKMYALKRGGTAMSKRLRQEISEDPEYLRCAFQGIHPDLVGECGGRVTREHAIIFAGKKVQEKWSIIPCCAKHHGVDTFQDGPGEAPKILRQWVALNRATEGELSAISKAVNYVRERNRLNDIYGQYLSPMVLQKAL